MIENAITSLILADASVVSATAALITQVTTYAVQVKTIAGTPPRVYRMQLPHNATADFASNLPAIVIGRQGTPVRTQTHDGPCELTNALVEVHAVALDGFTASRLLDVLRKLLDGWHGTAGAAVPGPTIAVQRIFVEDGRDLANDPIAAAEFPFAQSMFVLNCWYREVLA